MKTPFNEAKATQAAAVMLGLRGGPMSYMKLIKLLYLADRTALLRWGRSITTDSYFSMDRGPVLSRVLDLATDGEDQGAPSIWASHIGEPSHYEVALTRDPGRDELSDAEMHVLKDVFQKHGSLGRWELVELTHKLPEWKHPHGSAIPISVRDILKAGGKSDLEIAAIEDEIDGVAIAESILGAA